MGAQQEQKYTLMAELLYTGQIRRVEPTLTDTLGQLFLVVCAYKAVVLARADQYIVTEPIGWGWLRLPDFTNLVCGIMKLNPRDKTFTTFAQALTYLDLCVTQGDNMQC